MVFSKLEENNNKRKAEDDVEIDVEAVKKKEKRTKEKEEKKEKREKKAKEKKEKKNKNKEPNSDGDSEEEIEIDLDAPEPLSKKQARLLKKGKIDENKKSTTIKEVEEEESTKRSEFGVWIGNLSYDTTKDDLRRFLIAKTAANEKEEDRITDKTLTRVHLPKSKGFAYVDFTTANQVDACVALSESHLNGRNLLIKNSKSFEGRPVKQEKPPSRILFVGNLSFDTKEDDLQMHFQHCGEIIKVRMATFEDTGNCKGFAFIDFKEIQSATKGLEDKRCKKLHGRLLKLEYGEDRSKRTKQDKQKSSIGGGRRNEEIFYGEVTEQTNQAPEAAEQPETFNKPPNKKVWNKDKTPRRDRAPNRTAPGLALATAQRAKVSIVASSGKKVTFD